MPNSIRQCCQSMLAMQWTHRIPLIQSQPPAHLAAAVIAEIIDRLTSTDLSKLTVIDFCSGRGGPTPTFERIINTARTAASKAPIMFQLSDLHPHRTAWRELFKQSEHKHLGWITRDVDATDPPASVLSVNSPRQMISTGSSDSRICRLFSLAFHHFDDVDATKVIQSMLQTAEGIAIIELQDRRLGCLLMVLGNIFLCLLTTIFWFPFWHSDNWTQLFFTYIIPVLPFVLMWDGLASCWRTREFEEVMVLITDPTNTPPQIRILKKPDGSVVKRCDRAGWSFEAGRSLHTWPFGYMNWIVGWKR